MKRLKTKNIMAVLLLTLFMLSPLMPLAHAQAAITISPTVGAIGTEITVSGSGWTDGLGPDITVWFDKNRNGLPDESPPALSVISPGVTDWTTTVTVPDHTPGGSYSVIAKQALTEVAETFIVVPSIEIDPTGGPLGTTVTVTGSGFSSLGSVSIYRDEDFIEPKVRADLTGEFTSIDHVTIPFPGPVEPYAIRAVDELTGRVAEATFTSEPGIVLEPEEGPVGITVDVKGSGFHESDETTKYNVTLTFDATEVGWSLTDEYGCFIAPFEVPCNPPAPYTVTATDNASEPTTHWKTFTILEPIIEISPDAGPVGAEVEVDGDLFAIGSDVTIWFSVDTAIDATDILVETAPAASLNETGGFTTAFLVPDVTLGVYYVIANDTCNTAPEQAFTVSSPAIIISPDHGPVGTEVEVEGEYFAIGKDVTVYFYYNTTHRDIVGTVLAGELGPIGNFTTTFEVPEAVNGVFAHRVNATDGVNWAGAGFDVEASITLTPSSGCVGDSVTVAGTGFTADSLIDIEFNGFIFDDVALTDDRGSFTADFIVPDVPSDVYTVTATDETMISATAIFSVIPPELRAILEAVEKIEAKLDEGGDFYTFVTGGFSDVLSAINTAATAVLDAIDALSADVAAIKAKLDDSVYGLAAIKTAIDAISVEVDLTEVITAIDTAEADIIADIESKLTAERLAKIDSIVWADITAIKTAVETDIPTKLGDIKTAVDAIDISGIELKLDDIKAKTDTIIWTDITAIKTAVEAIDISPVLTELGSETYGLAAIKTAVDAIDLSGVETTLADIKAKTDTIMWTDITAIKIEVSDIEAKLDVVQSDLSGIKAAIMPPSVIEGTEVCPDRGSVELFSVDKTMTDGNPFEVSFTIDATELDSYNYVYVNVYVRATAESDLVLARQTRIRGRTGAYPYEVYMDSLVNAEEVVVELAWNRGTTSDDPIHFQAVISSP